MPKKYKRTLFSAQRPRFARSMKGLLRCCRGRKMRVRQTLRTHAASAKRARRTSIARKKRFTFGLIKCFIGFTKAFLNTLIYFCLRSRVFTFGLFATCLAAARPCFVYNFAATILRVVLQESSEVNNSRRQFTQPPLNLKTEFYEHITIKNHCGMAHACLIGRRCTLRRSG